ncbi:unnamed protein product [Hydatigera taeniaeformis]|uniref:Secreted protein n=1 Tax=Hydatigena taeniaeformis TaxID=6205 RepID=A0A0R3WWS5_HYDTA|nr:unnamed protein product [Hydatigera taeniaeformis]
MPQRCVATAAAAVAVADIIVSVLTGIISIIIWNCKCMERARINNV